MLLWLDAAGFKGHIAAVAEEDVEPAEAHEAAKQRPEIRWGVGASVLLHVPLIALLIFGLPKIEPKPPGDESVKVELVPPPEEKKPEEKKAEEKPKEEQKAQQQAKAEPPPPPPSPKSPPPPARVKGMTPVFEFGDKDSGPTKNANGNASEGEIGNTPVPPPPSGEMQPERLPEAAKNAKPADQPPGNPIPKEVNLPEIATAAIHPERDAPAPSSEEARTSFEAEKPETKPATQSGQTSKTSLPEVKKLFSRYATDDPVARTALGNMSRGERMNELCMTELTQQIEHASPKYRGPEIPRYPPFTNQTVIQVLETGRFRVDGDWYRMQFECEVDPDATKILSFAFKLGELIPRSQYAKYKIRE
ncbi:DUF930 domain-containing protein [Rhizobium sp. S9]|uniref:DUF930 domain-containing protein n=1 Tax=unclassified Rhizobium TaxID=2613769 RepID=UPI0032AF079F